MNDAGFHRYCLERFLATGEEPCDDCYRFIESNVYGYESECDAVERILKRDDEARRLAMETFEAGMKLIPSKDWPRGTWRISGRE